MQTRLWISLIVQKYYLQISWLHTVKKVSNIPVPSQDVTYSIPDSPWAGKIKLFPPRESLVSDIPAGDGNAANLFGQCRTKICFLWRASLVSSVWHWLVVLGLQQRDDIGLLYSNEWRDLPCEILYFADDRRLHTFTIYQQLELYTAKKAFRYSRPQPGPHIPNSPWAGIMMSYINYSRLTSRLGMRILKSFYTVYQERTAEQRLPWQAVRAGLISLHHGTNHAFQDSLL